VGRQLHLLDRPALPVRKILGLQSFEELQHARQALLVIDVLDRGMSSRRIGRHVVLQQHGNIDQSSGHRRFLEGSVCSSDVSSLRRPGALPCFSKLRFFRRQVRLQSDRLDAGLDNDITPFRHLVLDTLLDGRAYL
jgi:hypothetical protein